MLLEVLMALSTGILGIFLGAQIAEGALFVPYWKALPAKEFYELHKTYGKKIYQFFAPLTILATIIPLITVGYSLLINVQNPLFFYLTGLFTILFFSSYFLFFKKANQQFADASIPYDELPAAINTWGNWHWGRIVFEFMAFVCCILALLTL